MKAVSLEREVGLMASNSPLSYNLSEILPEGLEVDRDATAADLGLSEADARLEGTLHVSATLHKQDSCVLVTGLIDGTALRQCVRCLKSFAEPLLVSFSGEFAKKPTKPALPARSKPGKAAPKAEPEETDETDVYEYVGEVLDLAPMLREQVILAEPMQPICREECLGLCPVCGQDRNQVACRCQTSAEGTLAEKLRAAQAKQTQRQS